MGIQEVQGNNKAQTYQNRKNAGRGEGFQESFLQNLKNRDQAKQAVGDERTEKGQTIADTRNETKKKTESVGVGRIMKAGIRVNAAAVQGTLQAVEVRHMSYEESDHVKIAVTEGYTLKGKREEGTETRVYVEAKYEDGRLEAYQVETDRVSENTKQEIERFALETIREA